LKRPGWEQKTGKAGLEAALTMLRGHAEVLRWAKALARAVEDLEGWNEAQALAHDYQVNFYGKSAYVTFPQGG
jgi:hypothetical protein